MNKMSSIKKICICAICIALCYVLPIAFHALGLGSALSPMHIPVLLCGLICGGLFGCVCGIFGPILSSLLSGMPPVTMLFTMIPELLVYGLAAGLMMHLVRTRKLVLDLYIALAVAMLLGRVAGGIARTVFMAVTAAAEPYSITLWISSYFIGSLPGIIAHLVLIPVLVLTLSKAKVIPHRYTVTA